LQGEHLQSVEAMKSPPEFMMGRQLIGSRKAINRLKLANPAVSMRDVAL